jgi:hypothetical protein
MKFLYDNFGNDYGLIKNSSKVFKVQEIIQDKLELEAQLLSFKKFGFEDTNLVSFVRSKRGFGHECNLWAFPLDYEYSVKVGIALMYNIKNQSPDWIAKDTIFLFYRESSYSLSTKAFIEDYFSETSPLQGRCGYIRHALIYK